MVLVLLQYNRTWQHLVCHHICSFAYYILAPKFEVHCSLLPFSNNCVCRFNVTLCHTSQQFRFSLQYFLIVTLQVKYTCIHRTLGKHKHVCISKVTFSDSNEKYDYVVCITQHSFPLHLLILQSLLLTTPPKYLWSSLPFQNFQHW